MLHLTAHYAGRLISSGQGRHVDRIITDWELILVIAGTLSMYVESDDFSLRPGEALLIGPGVRHGGIGKYPAGLSFYWLHFVPQDPGSRDALLALPRSFAVGNPGLLAECIHLHLALQSEAAPDHEALDRMIGLILHKALSPCTETGSGLPPLLQLALRRIKLDYREKITAQTLAAELHCNSDYLERLARRHLRSSITTLVNAERLKRARALLENSTLNVSEVAAEVGFADPGYFRRLFRREFAIPPRDFMQSARIRKINAG